MNITNNLNLPQPFVDAASSDYQHTDKRYGVTSFMKEPREAILLRRHETEITEDVADRVWQIFGTAVHFILQNAQETESQIKENYIVVDAVNGYELSGIFDLYDDATGTVTDYKTCAVWKIIHSEFDDWRMQTLIYCWMLRKIGFEAKRGEIVAIAKDHSKRDARFKSDYPKHPVFRIGWDFTAQDFEGIETEIAERFAEIERCEQLPDDELPLCAPEKRWHKDDSWAVMPKGYAQQREQGKKPRAKRVFDNEAEAAAMAADKGLEVEFRPGEDPKCVGYCSACEFCTYWQENYGKEA